MPKFCRYLFLNVFPDQKYYLQLASVNLGLGSVLNQRWAIVWNSDDQVLRGCVVSPGHKELIYQSHSWGCAWPVLTHEQLGIFFQNVILCYQM